MLGCVRPRRGLRYDLPMSQDDDNPDRIGETIVPPGSLAGVDTHGKPKVSKRAVVFDNPQVGDRAFIFDNPSLIDQHTLTSAASLSAEVFSPDQSEMVDAYLAAQDNVSKEKVFLLADETVVPLQVGIETDLEPKVYTALSKIKRADIENEEKRAHDIRQAEINARGPIWAEVAKWLLGVAGWLLVAILFWLQKFGGGV